MAAEHAHKGAESRARDIVELAQVHDSQEGIRYLAAFEVLYEGLIVRGHRALAKLVQRLRQGEDTANARLLAEILANIDSVAIDVDAVETNIVIFKLTGGISAADVVARLKARGILASALTRDAIRLVTHLDVDSAACVTAAEAPSAEALSGNPFIAHADMPKISDADTEIVSDTGEIFLNTKRGTIRIVTEFPSSLRRRGG